MQEVDVLELFDTTYIIDLANSDDGAIKKAENIDTEGTTPALSVITAHEYLLGVHIRYRGNRLLLASKLARARQDLGSFEILPLTQEITEVSSEIHSDLSIGGRVIGINDIYIAATAIYYNTRLVTRNVSHFKRIRNLNMESY